MSQLRDLARKFPADTIQKNPSGYGDYVPHHFYVQRLLMHLDRPFQQHIERELYEDLTDKAGVVHPKVLVGVVMRLTVTIDGHETEIEEVGDCESPFNWPTNGARGKDAVSDAIKRCCARIGLGTHLYAKQPDDYVLYRVLTEHEKDAEIEAGPSGGGEPSGQTLVAGNPAGESKDLTVPANLSPAPSELSGVGGVTVSNGGTDTASSGGGVGNPALEFCEACLAGDCQHCAERLAPNSEVCGCYHDEGRPM